MAKRKPARSAARRPLRAPLPFRKPVQNESDELRQAFQTLYDFAPVMYLLLDATGVIMQTNRTACRLLKSTPDRMVGFPLRSFMLNADRPIFLEHLRRCRAGGDAVEAEMRLVARDGGTFTGRLFSKRSAHRGRVVFPTIVLDLTELLVTERARLGAERERDRAEQDRQLARASDAAKDRLIAVVSHELRNPLSPALMAAEALASWNGLPEAARRLATIIKRNIDLEARLIEDLLDVARVARGRLDLDQHPVDIHKLLAEVIGASQASAQSKGLHITGDLQAQAHHVPGDEGRLRQVFANLLNNAIKFTDKGEIGVRTSNRTYDAVRITVTDQGVGIDEESLRSLFVPFGHPDAPTGHRGGLGLGLSVAKGIIEAHDGSLSARSSGTGRGSTFEVELPVCGAPDKAVAPQQELARNGLDGTATPRMRVLVVEDHDDTSQLLKMFLSDRGFDVTVAESLAEGLRQLDGGWDFVISDLGLEDGSGLEVARRAKRLTRPPRRMIALTGFGATQDIVATFRAGFDDHLVKPIDLTRLSEAMSPPPEAAEHLVGV